MVFRYRSIIINAADDIHCGQKKYVGITRCSSGPTFVI